MKINTKNAMSLVSKAIGKRQRGRNHGSKIGLALGALVSISLLVLAGCPASVTNPVQQIMRGGPDPVTPDPDPDSDPNPDTFTRDSNNLRPTDLAVTVQLSSAEVSQGESVQITATVTNTSDHASNGHALLVFYKSDNRTINPALLDVDLGYTISDSAIKAIEEALREGYGLDPAISAALREQDLNEQERVDANKKLVIDAALDPIFASLVIAPLASGAIFTLAEPINIPDTVDIGSAYYGACVVLDRFNCQSAELKVITSEKPVLRAVAPRFNVPNPNVGYYASGASVTATGTVYNAGGAEAKSVKVALYRVGNAKPVGTQTIASIAANTAPTDPPNPNATFTFNVLEYTKKGTYTEQYYFAITEVDGNELDAENNRSDSNSLTVYVGIDNRKFIDSDGDLLIDIRNLDMLNNIRYNLAGTSYKTEMDAAGEQCLDISKSERTLVDCEGYELMQDLDFASVSSYGSEGYWDHADWRPNNSDPAAASNAGWPPIGGTFSAIFEGNGHTIRNLYSRNLATGGGAAYGLFSQVSGTVRNLTVEDSAIYGSDYTDYIGTVIGYLQAGGKAINISARRGVIDTKNAIDARTTFPNLGHSGSRYYVDNPQIRGKMDIAGGLVGTNAGTIAASSSAVLVIGAYDSGRVRTYNNWAYADKLGGLVGDNTRTGNIVASYSLSTVIGDGARRPPRTVATYILNASSDRIGGIAGTNYGEILSSYSLGNLNGQGELDYIGGITGGLGYPPTVRPSPTGDAPVVFSTYSTSVAYGGVAQESIPALRTLRKWNCVGPITGFNHFDRTGIERSYFFGKIINPVILFNCLPNTDFYRRVGGVDNVGIDQLSGSDTGWATNDATSKKYSGVSTRAWIYPADNDDYAAPALQYANYADYTRTDGPDKPTNYAEINYCNHLSPCSGPLPDQPLTDQGDTVGAAYSIDTPFHPGGGLSIPATIESKSGGDKDYFKITVIKAGEIVIESLRSRGVNMQVQLLNSAGALVEYDDDDGEENNFRIYRYIPRGEYIIRAYAHGNATGSYIISMQMVD